MSASAYDAVAYGSRAVPLTHPDHLALAALLAGLEPAPPERCRVLELGCAEAANLVAMAFHLEEARFVGVDASAVQIGHGREVADRLGLDNLELKHADILELGDDLGTFDYIIVHGVLSWVAQDVRERILELIRGHLAPQGVAYLGYNCAGGWAMRSELRRLALQRASSVEAVDEKIARVRELFGILASSPLREVSAHTAALAEQASLALAHRDSYLFHEYLSPINELFRHRDVLELAQAHELALVAELARPTNDVSVEESLRAGLTERLKSATDPGNLDAEEVFDVMLGRSFRASVFCHRAAVRDDLGPELPRAVARRAFFRAAIRPEDSRFSLDPDVAEAFVTADGTKVSVRHHRLKAALWEIGKSWPRALSLTEIEARTSMLLELRRVLPPGKEITAQEGGALMDDLLELHRLGHIDMRLREPELAAEPGPTPRVSALTRLEAERDHVVTSPRHEAVALNAFARHLVGHLDGTREVDELVGRVREHFVEAGLVLHAEDGTPLSEEQRAAALPGMLRGCLQELALRSLLTSA